MKKLMFLLLVLLSFTSVYALEICPPTKEYQDYMELDDSEKANYVVPPRCGELNNNLSTVTYKRSKSIGASSSDSSYNAMNAGYVTSIKNQGNLGTCWAFSSISAVESNALKNNIGTYDFSESHMIYSSISAAYKDEEGKFGKYYTNSFTGGKVTYAASYYFNNIGQLNESEMPYTSREDKIFLSDYPTGRKMISVGSFEIANINPYGVCSSTEISDIKNKIIRHGAVQGSMYYDDSLFKDSAFDYYISTTRDASFPNHGISIIGWDDNVSKTKFNASRNGAWIVKNSWGPNWSTDGLFYVSYDDYFICKNTTTFYDVSSKTFDNTYTSADMVGDTIVMFSNTFYTASRFNIKTQAELIERVSYSVGPNMSYYVYISKNNSLDQNNWELLTHGTSNSVGIKSIDLNNIEVNNDFTIIVKYVVNSNEKSSVFTMCNTEDDTAYMNYSSDTNYYSFGSTRWYDMNSMEIGEEIISCEPNIFVYTKDKTSSNSYVKINSIISANDNITVSITRQNVDGSDMTYKIKGTSNNDVTSSFNITPNYNTNVINIKSKGSVSGTFSFIIEYNGKSVKANFDVVENIVSKDTSFAVINGSNIIVTIPSNFNLTFDSLLARLIIKNTTVNTLNKSNNEVTSSTKVTTDSKLRTNSKTYNIVVLGDITGTGTISVSDVMKLATHVIKGNIITGEVYIKASDVTRDGKLTISDVMKLATYVIKGGVL